MKLYFSLPSTILLTLTLSCTDSMGPPKTTDNSSREPSSSLGKDLALDSSGSSAMLYDCCNNLWPDIFDNPQLLWGLKWCEEEEDDIISGRDCAEIWAKYNPTEGVQLGFQACGGSEPEMVPPVATLDGSVVNNHPKLDWSFVGSHYYVIKRKIAAGSWVTIETQDNCLTQDYSCGDTYFIDNNINVSTLTNNVYYRVYSEIFDEEARSAPQVEFQPPVNVTISGPTQLTTLETGQFTANVTSGVPPYSYTWYKYQYCDERLLMAGSQDGMRGPPCGSWRLLPSSSATITTGGNIPGFSLKVIVTDNNNNTDIDYHSVIVVLP